jgi:SpoIID/LytB domain protein
MLFTRSNYHRSRISLARASIAAWVLGMLLSAPVWATSTAEGGQAPARAQASAARASTLVIDGAGEGHGVGMSQDGALGYAERGWPYMAILSHYYTGTALGQAPPNTVVRVLLHGKVKRVALEAYVRGVVAAEVSSSWPMAALQAQAVASRTYAITAHAGGARFDVYPDTRSQMYLGRAAETARTNAAVAATAGQIVTYAGQPAITYFFAGSGGFTESVQYAFPGASPQPWLVGVLDPYDAGPLHRWTKTLSFRAAASRLSGLVKGSFEGVEVVRRGSSPRIVSAWVLGSKGRTLVGGPELAARLGLYDTWAYFSVKDSHGLRPEPDASERAGATPAQAAPPSAQPAHVSGTPGRVGRAGGAAATPATALAPSAQPTQVSGAGGSAAAPGPARAPSGQAVHVSGTGGVPAV